MKLSLQQIFLLILLPVFGLLMYVYRGSAPHEAFSVPTSPIPIATSTGPISSVTSQEKTLAAPPAKIQPVASVVALGDIKQCLAKPMGQSAPCLDGLFQKYLKTHQPKDALLLVQGYEDSDSQLRLSCHPVVHAIGRETFRLKGTVHDSFAACDQTCHSGCYHGAMERFIRGDGAENEERHVSEAELQAKALSACDPTQATRFRFQCLHGLGHALMFFSDYNLRSSLTNCDVFKDGWSRSSCYGGVFMENLFSATPEKRDVSKTDYQYPCNALALQYRPDCYMMQTTRMTEMGLSTAQLFEECRKAGDYRFTCMQSIGRDLSNDVRVGDPKVVAKKCEFGIDEERRACVRGVSYALLDNTWDGRYAFPFCSALGEDADSRYCFSLSASYLKSLFEKTKDELVKQCANYVPGVLSCREEVEKL